MRTPPFTALPPTVVALAATNPPAPTALNDIRGPVEIASHVAWLARAVPVALVLGLLAAAWWRSRRRRPGPGAIRESAAARARARLSGAWGLMGQPERFCTRLSEIVRVYLEERFRLRAPERTTEEFLGDLRGSIALDLAHKRLLEEFLTACDLAKFARGEPGREELEALHRAASRLVDETGAEMLVPGRAERREAAA
jgi:hypothetical protein